METVLFVAVILLGLTVVGPILARLVVAYRKGLAEIEEKEALARHNREAASAAAAQTAALEAEIAQLIQEAEALVVEKRPIEESLSPANLAKRARIYMPSERWSTWDEEYIVTITNPQFDISTFHAEIVEAWRKGRQHVFWAQSEAAVRQAAEARFPSALGYEVKSVEISRDRILVHEVQPVAS